ncbi:MAG: flagellar hook-basal body protein [Selenomonadaceae bacterium]|nr:flagellar hook-basal body protein [Selenomonadaceae bacterium]
MWRGLYTAATGMISEAKRTDTIAHNLANADTTGYKKDITVHKEFHNMLIQRVNDFDQGGILGVATPPFNSLAELGTSKEDVTQIKGFTADPFYRPNIGQLGLGDYIDEIAVDYRQGALESTGNAYDLAIVGEGFFALQTPDGVRYSRNGAFFKNSQGYLQDIRGYNLLDTQGNPIRIPANIPDSQVSITGNGVIYVPGNLVQLNPVTNRWEAIGDMDARQPLAQIQFVEFGDRLATQKQGDNLYYLVNDNEGNPPPMQGLDQNVQARLMNPDMQPRPASGELLQGSLEKSNTAIVYEMVELIHNQRMYEANSKAVMTQDAMLEKSVNSLGSLNG